MCDMNHLYVWHAAFIRVTWLIHMCDMTHSYVWHDSVIRVTWLIHMCDMTQSYVWHDSVIRVTWLIRMCGAPRSYVWHASFDCMTCLSSYEVPTISRLPQTLGLFRKSAPKKKLYSAKETYIFKEPTNHSKRIDGPRCPRLLNTPSTLYVWPALFIRVTWLTYMRDMPRSYMWHDVFKCGTCLMELRGSHNDSLKLIKRHPPPGGFPFFNVPSSPGGFLLINVSSSRTVSKRNPPRNIWYKFSWLPWSPMTPRQPWWLTHHYRVASFSRIHKIIGFLCKRAL